MCFPSPFPRQADLLLSQWSLCGDSLLSLSSAAVSAAHHRLQGLLEELLGTGWHLTDALGELRDMTDDHIRVILETSRKDGLYAKGTKRVAENIPYSRVSLKITYHKQLYKDTFKGYL